MSDAEERRREEAHKVDIALKNTLRFAIEVFITLIIGIPALVLLIAWAHGYLKF